MGQDLPSLLENSSVTCPNSFRSSENRSGIGISGGVPEMKHFVECVRDGDRPRDTYEGGYIVNRILHAGYDRALRLEYLHRR